MAVSQGSPTSTFHVHLLPRPADTVCPHPAAWLPSLQPHVFVSVPLMLDNLHQKVGVPCTCCRTNSQLGPPALVVTCQRASLPPPTNRPCKRSGRIPTRCSCWMPQRSTPSELPACWRHGGQAAATLAADCWPCHVVKSLPCEYIPTHLPFLPIYALVQGAPRAGGHVAGFCTRAAQREAAEGGGAGAGPAGAHSQVGACPSAGACMAFRAALLPALKAKYTQQCK